MAKTKTALRGGKAANDNIFDQSDLHDTSTASQRNRLLHALRFGPVSTFIARQKLNICHPGGRICELRQLGYNIETHWREATTEQGFKHRIAEYVLFPGKSKRRSA